MCALQDLKRTKLNLAELECKQRRGNSELAQTEEKTAGLQQQIENMSAEKESLAQQMEEQRSQIQQLQDEVKELATRAQEELVEKERQLYDAHHATDKVNVCFSRHLWLCVACACFFLQKSFTPQVAWIVYHLQTVLFILHT